ncbi:diiron oxygenase [Actinoplanes regularis]|uniref:p-aminobenzoate N-oxygenase AurF n=1 Tax=Actinoplanes regularis TaxID=52697 RepID=A0A238X590_9ACTN|nr:diiron oxygenase [Actinoplanes regularis]GIE86440.1 hypothetical protein Are01nite_29200 [Actinoplanes regularis]SNR53870.1 P-aminobenzoate N-oxygenase AurF [Actinoplanes regularis]
MYQISDAPERPTVARYRSAFSNWEERASVRVGPRRSLDADDGSDIYFPPELVPVVAHPYITERGPEVIRRILVHRLYQYLNFTTLLETSAVIPVTSDIGIGRCGLQLDARMRRDAFKITTDEAWHAQFSDDLIADVVAHTGVPVTLPDQPSFLSRLAVVRESIEPSVRGAAPLAFAIVSETLISSILRDLPKDRRLPGAVREVVADHAEDEGKHHAYFRSLISTFWPALTKGQQQQLGPLLPELITIFLEPDFQALSYALLEVGLTDAEVEQVLAESHPREETAAGIARAAKATVRYLREVGALDDGCTREAFQRSALIP